MKPTAREEALAALALGAFCVPEQYERASEADLSLFRLRPSRLIVHSMRGLIGADWDLEAAVSLVMRTPPDLIRWAEPKSIAGAVGHPLIVDGVAFAVTRPRPREWE